MTYRRVAVTSAGLTTSVTAYTSGDSVGTEFVFALTPATTLSSGRGVILGASIIDEGNVLAACDLAIFNAASTPAADNAANAWSDANIRNFVGVIKFATADVNASANNRFASALLGSPLPFEAPTGSLYGSLITRSANAVFTAVTDVTLSLFIDFN